MAKPRYLTTFEKATTCIHHGSITDKTLMQSYTSSMSQDGDTVTIEVRYIIDTGLTAAKVCKLLDGAVEETKRELRELDEAGKW